MNLSDIDRRLVLATLSKMGPTFRTRELSAHPDMVRGHHRSGDSSYHAMVGRYLSSHVADVELLKELKGPKGVLWKNLRSAGASATGASEPSGQADMESALESLFSGTTGGAPVRQGHLRALEQIERGDAYARTRQLYRDAPGGIEVYLRITDAGFTVLSLDAQHCASMIGVGGRGTQDHTIRSLPPPAEKVRAAVAGYVGKRNTLRRPSDEEVYALELIETALAHGLALPGLHTHFIAQEWRLPSGGRPDLIAVDLGASRIVVIELKDSASAARQVDASKGGDAWEQARAYAAEIHQHRAALYPFFQRLGRALARHHQGPPAMQSLNLDPALTPDILVSWPGGGFRR